MNKQTKQKFFRYGIIGLFLTYMRLDIELTFFLLFSQQIEKYAI
jgi:hypothetical protein